MLAGSSPPVSSVVLDVAADFHGKPTLGELEDLLIESSVVYVAVLDDSASADREADLVPRTQLEVVREACEVVSVKEPREVLQQASIHARLAGPLVVLLAVHGTRHEKSAVVFVDAIGHARRA